MAVGMLTSPPRASFLPHCLDHSADPNQSLSSVEVCLTPDHCLLLLSARPRALVQEDARAERVAPLHLIQL